ncbi:MAG: hypothetical protein HYU69_14200 [Bacteroidetes bacterium]|nr:hypothetical protein [Bacteroidota bacterium]
MTQVTKWLAIGSIAFAVSISGCKKADPVNTNSPSGAYGSGIFITCEGPYGSGTGTVSFYNRSTGAVSNDIFQTANSLPLGNVVQSMSVYNGKGYVAVNNAGKVEVVTADNFKSSGTITGVNQPRYFLGIDNSKGYVTEWGTTGLNGAVKVINLATNTVSSTINTGKGAEKMVKSGNSVYVTCKGGFDNDSVVTVINSTTDVVSTSIKVGPNPDGIQVDANGKIWVLCGGRWNTSFTALAETGALVRINPSNNTVEQTYTFSSTSSTPSNLSINGAKNKLYYTYQGNIYTQDISAPGLSSTAFIGRSFYGMGIDSANDYLYGADAGNFSSNGYVIRFNATGSKVDSFQVGVIPNGFFFK